MKKIIPLDENVLIEMIINKETPGGILLPEGKENPHTGYVRAIGSRVPLNVSSTQRSRCIVEGDKVYLPRGTTLGDKFEDEHKLLLNVPYKYISAIIEDESA